MDTRTCPGCGERLYKDWADGWRNDNGFTCGKGRLGTHQDEILNAGETL